MKKEGSVKVIASINKSIAIDLMISRWGLNDMLDLGGGGGGVAS